MDNISIIFFLLALAIAVTILHTFLKQAGARRICLSCFSSGPGYRSHQNTAPDSRALYRGTGGLPAL